MRRIVISMATVAVVVLPSLAGADTLLEFFAKGSAKDKAMTQSILIKDGRIMVKGAVGSGSNHLDYLFDRWTQTVTVIDHRKHTVTKVDEAQVDRLNQQASTVQPLVQGLAEEVAKLSPAERRKWQDLLGGSVSLDKIAQAAQPLPPTTLMPSGRSKLVAGIRCQPTRIVQGATAMADLCLAEASAMGMPDSDYATIRALVVFYERLAGRSQKVANQFGIVIPKISAREVTGVPIELRDLSRPEKGSTATLRRISIEPLAPEMLEAPAGYDPEPLAPWE